MSLDRHYEVLYVHMYPYMICAVLAAATVDKHVHFFLPTAWTCGGQSRLVFRFPGKGYVQYVHTDIIHIQYVIPYAKSKKKTPPSFSFFEFWVGWVVGM